MLLMTRNSDYSLEKLKTGRRERIPARIAIVDAAVRQSLRAAQAEWMARLPMDYGQLQRGKVMDAASGFAASRPGEQPAEAMESVKPVSESKASVTAIRPDIESMINDDGTTALEQADQRLNDLDKARKAVNDAYENQQSSEKAA